MQPIYHIMCQSITGEEQALSIYQGKVLLIVNTASRCGFTPQFQGLEQLYQQYQSRGFEILGFPCNQFGHQEPGSHEEIFTFCQTHYNVTFPMFAKIEVNGSNTHPLYRHLKNEAPGVLGSTTIKWNFTKFLIDQSGAVKQRFSPPTRAEDIAPAIQQLFDSIR